MQMGAMNHPGRHLIEEIDWIGQNVQTTTSRAFNAAEIDQVLAKMSG